MSLLARKCRLNLEGSSQDSTPRSDSHISSGTRNSSSTALGKLRFMTWQRHSIGRSLPSCSPPRISLGCESAMRWYVRRNRDISGAFRGRYLVGRIHSVVDRVGAGVERCGVGPLVGARCASASPPFSPLLDRTPSQALSRKTYP